MIEFLRHLFGFCGENHPSVITLEFSDQVLDDSQLASALFLNYENNILLQDEEVTEPIHQRQLQYIASSHIVNPEDVAEWSIAQRMWQNIVATLGPVL